MFFIYEMTLLIRARRLLRILKYVISGRSMGQVTGTEIPQKGYSHNVSNTGNYVGALNPDDPTDLP